MIIEFNEPMVSLSKSKFDRRIEEANSEVASEIFEEIEKIAKTVGFPDALVNGMIVNRILDGMYLDCQDFAELKKKYTGEQT